MKRLILLVLLVVFGLIPSAISQAHTTPEFAFIRNDDLWVKIGGQEKAITHSAYIRYPRWSRDGRFLAYLEGMNSNRLWIYDSKTGKKHMIFQTGVNYYEWSPVSNELAFQSGKVLNVTDSSNLGANTKFHNVMLGVGNFSWMPDGKGFIVSSEANLLPSGWSQVELYKVPLDANMNPTKAKLFFTLPKNTEQFMAISTSPFKWSSDGKWISFIGVPTASLSADSDTLCILSSDGKQFMIVDQMLMDQEWFKWAKTKNWLAYIEGTGRMAVQNKHLKVKKLPANGLPSFTPDGYVDRGFTWVSDEKIIVSRAKEAKWNNDPKKRPLPSLYQIDILTGRQKQITHPKSGYGDFNPIFQNDQLYWARTNRKSAQLLIGEPDGKNSKIVIDNMDAPPDYYENRDWQAILSIH